MKIVEKGNFTDGFLYVASVVDVAVFIVFFYCDFSFFVNRIVCMVVVVVGGAIGCVWESKTCNVKIFQEGYEIEWKIKKGSKD